MNDIVDELREIQRMNTTLHGAQMAARAADEIERLRGMLEVQDEMVKHYVAERDEARRRVCEMEAECIVYPPCSPQEYAVRMGWNCYEEAQG